VATAAACRLDVFHPTIHIKAACTASVHAAVLQPKNYPGVDLLPAYAHKSN